MKQVIEAQMVETPTQKGVTMSQQKASLPVDLINAVLGYLGKRPYEETYQLINAIQTQVAMIEAEEQKQAAESE